MNSSRTRSTSLAYFGCEGESRCREQVHESQCVYVPWVIAYRVHMWTVFPRLIFMISDADSLAVNELSAVVSSRWPYALMRRATLVRTRRVSKVCARGGSYRVGWHGLEELHLRVGWGGGVLGDAWSYWGEGLAGYACFKLHSYGQGMCGHLVRPLCDSLRCIQIIDSWRTYHLALCSLSSFKDAAKSCLVVGSAGTMARKFLADVSM
ncbi:UNVERIFIED_CONTAM: hypothetical protein Sangu_2113600 [Sesamum angustifolium]|uniref:Uncharacterized protein n=1 Tax=Sesamum angustifolium TaxID=2727405 RepID=A0AAW2LE55_9LAMI